jgi:ankyrin repeat protein
VTALWVTASLGQPETVNLLLEKGADVESRDKNGSTPLWIAAADGHVDVMNLLLKKGAAIDAKDNNGCTPLWIATQNGILGMVKLLLDKGANPNVEAMGSTPLQIAKAKGYREIAELLQQAETK